MTSIRKSLAVLGSDLQLFAPQISSEVQELRRNVEVRPVTGATLYRHCLEDLNERLTSLSEDVSSLEAVSLDAISLEELVGHCAALYESNYKAIAALEAQLQSYGYSEAHIPVPPQNPLDMLHFNSGGAMVESIRASGDSESFSPVDVPPSLSRYAYTGSTAPTGNHTTAAPPSALAPRHKTAAEALAPMTAAKARARADTPSSASLSSPEALTPSMRHLLGKYASDGSISLGGSSDDRLSGLLPSSRSARKGASGRHAMPLQSPVPPLSPAFAAAAEHQRAQMKTDENAEDLATAHAAQHHEHHQQQTPMDGDFATAEALLASTAEKLANNPALLNAYREKYPCVAASAERLVAGRTAGCVPPSHQAHFDASWLQPHGELKPAWEEESTMELKNQVIFNRSLSQGNNHYATATPLAGGGGTAAGYGAALSATPSTAALMNKALGGGTYQPTPASVPSSAGGAIQSKESLQEAIAVALGRNATSNAPTPQAGATPAMPTTSGTLPSAGARGLPSSRSGGSALTPSLPSAVPPYRPVDQSKYSSLPAFIRGQLPLETLNEASAAVHGVATRRCASGEGASFSMDDVEAAGALPAGKGKVLVNALAKLGHVQLKVLYGQGTVYFFSSV